MNRMPINVMLVSAILLCVLSRATFGSTGGFTQSSFFSTNGGVAAGVAESSVIGPDGVKKGQCSYTNTKGDHISIKYEEDSNGKLLGSKILNGTMGISAQELLAECRGNISNMSANVNGTLKEVNKQIDEFQTGFQEHMNAFNRQQEAFARQHEAFMRQIEDFSSSFWKPFGRRK